MHATGGKAAPGREGIDMGVSAQTGQWEEVKEGGRQDRLALGLSLVALPSRR
jgi:hypothetical protein